MGHEDSEQRRTIPLPLGAEGGKMVISPCDGKLYVVDWYGPNLFAVDPVSKAVTTKSATSSSAQTIRRLTSRPYVIDVTNKVLTQTITFGTLANGNVVAIAPAPTQCVP